MMTDDMMMMKMKWLRKNVMIDALTSISFSVFGMLLIFGLGFVFPTINPYVVIKWIIIVAGVVFVLSFIRFIIYVGMSIRMVMMMKKDWKEAKVKKTSKSK